MKTFYKTCIINSIMLLMIMVASGFSFMLSAQTWQPVGGGFISSSAVTSSSIAIDQAGSPYVAFEETAGLKKASVKKFDGTAWVQVGQAGFSDGVVSSLNIKLDASNTPYLVYGDFGSSGIGAKTP
jgi:hypothetical protein